tara:strand:- start:10946 stop:11278 length:333 start_codon:yes stop_codon:yes gene_type:complete
MTWHPLPEGLTILPSKVHGLGLFTLKGFPKGHAFGITHVRDAQFPTGVIRTPLGGFYNHSEENPNAETYDDGRYIRLRAIRDIKGGEEITSRYRLYSMEPALYTNGDESI